MFRNRASLKLKQAKEESMSPVEMKLPKINAEAFSLVDFFEWWWNGDPAPPFIYLERDMLLEVAKIKMGYEVEVAKARVVALEKINQVIGKKR
jgi:hypothetical protein